MDVGWHPFLELRTIDTDCTELREIFISIIFNLSIIKFKSTFKPRISSYWLIMIVYSVYYTHSINLKFPCRWFRHDFGQLKKKTPYTFKSIWKAAKIGICQTYIIPKNPECHSKFSYKKFIVLIIASGGYSAHWLRNNILKSEFTEVLVLWMDRLGIVFELQTVLVQSLTRCSHQLTSFQQFP